MQKLFMVYLGGTAPKANIEIHDIQFVIGENIEDTYNQLKENWFGDKKGLHLDSYKEIKGADGYKIEIKEIPQKIDKKLYFVNFGAPQKDLLPEIHEFGLFVGKNKHEVKNKANHSLLTTAESKHKDNLLEIYDHTGNNYIHLTPTDEKSDLTPDWYGYKIISK